MSGASGKTDNGSRRVHLVNLFKWRSAAALAACLLTLALALWAIGYSFVSGTLKEVREMFRWFTIDSNVITALAAALLIPFAVQGVARKRLTYPKWMLLIHYSGTLCLVLTMAVSCGVISWADPKGAFGGANLFLHVVCPALIAFSFFMAEANHTLDRKDTLIALIPVAAYAALYGINVFVTRAWADHYRMDEILPVYVSAPLVLAAAYGIGWLIRVLYNRLHAARERKLKQVWEGSPDPVTVRIEIYSLGVHAGMHQEKDSVSVPFDILEEVSRQFDIKPETLARAYVKGAMDGLREKDRSRGPRGRGDEAASHPRRSG